MKLSTRTRYAVRAVFDIAYHGQGRATQARDTARRQDVPLRYLEQIFQELKRDKIVAGKRGPGGGYSLARSATEITVGDIVRAMQGPLEVLFDDGPPLAEGRGSRRRAEESRPPSDRDVPASLWQELAQQVAGCFDAVTVAELCRRGEALGLSRGETTGPMYFI